MTNTAVSFKNVDIIFGDNKQEALRLLDAGATRQEINEKTGAVLGVADASLDVAEGEIFVLMGLSGSGKSTLLRAVNRLNETARGEVVVSTGRQHRSMSPRAVTSELRELRMRQVAMVFQQFALLPWRTVEENVGLAWNWPVCRMPNARPGWRNS